MADERTALGPGTIAKYDHELAALAPLGLDDVTCDAALTFVLDFVRASARALLPRPHADELAEQWPVWGARLATYVGDDFPLARRVGAAAGEAMGAAHSPALAWEFGLARVLDGLAALA
ncbi:TetR/AcrR family transcriptional regulator C-terminal domain-containing protein [Nocardioides sp. TF02-7]|uniref:TetR/AcrR family transcriptional regulator C-terminal domain-containing protein n=1 Tax=Nocardioides sp. TF02-7 TaxID=2917724 RepID=UPI001F06B356|nr:TetR/AcrR family transcriptional regulator C-terminal domain-containing protein [Nocardioides sp. TF02-7]UMG94334.1 TetR/AcrR family transcriptional regulator C-terminal domain-containing protein [Nocardioides sp. TF02-7]